MLGLALALGFECLGLDPDVHVLEAEHARPLQVGDEHAVVDRAAVAGGLRAGRARGRGVEVADRVEVRDVYAVAVGLGARGAVLLRG